MSDEPTRCSRPECSVCDEGIRRHQEKYKRPPLGFNRPGDEFPTEWQLRDGFAREETRQIGPETYEVKVPEHILTIPKDGWEAYTKSNAAWLNWLSNHPVEVRLTDGKLDSSSMPDSST